MILMVSLVASLKLCAYPHVPCNAGLSLDSLRLAPRKSIAARSSQPSSAGVTIRGDAGAPMTLIETSAPKALVLTMDQSMVIVAFAAVTQAEPSSA